MIRRMIQNASKKSKVKKTTDKLFFPNVQGNGKSRFESEKEAM